MSTPAPVARASLPAYQYLTPPVNDMVALGIQSVIKYNGLVLNDRLRPDRYMVTEIDGLGSPDIRDNRDVRVAQHGEVAYDAFWGGDTITIAGTMYAGNVFELSRMERDLRAAFGTLVEKPMKFCWWDVHDEFSDAQTSAAMWAALAQSASFQGDGTMRFVYGSSSLTNPAILYYALRQYIDHTITTKCVLAPVTNGGQTLPYAGVIAKCSAANTYTLATVSTAALTLSQVVGGVTTQLATASLSLNSGTQYWTQLQCIGDQLVYSIYQTDPNDGTGNQMASVTATLVGAASQALGYLAQGFAGIYVGGQNATQTAIEDFRVDAIWPCDMVTHVRSISSPIVKNAMMASVTSPSRFKRDFQVTVRASNPRLTQPTLQTTKTIVLSTGNSPSFGRIYSRTYPLSYHIPLTALGVPSSIGASSFPIAECVNRGNWDAQPIIAINGGLSFPFLLDMDSGDFILLDGTIANGDYVLIDVANQTVTNSSGANVFSLWDPTSTWLTLPGAKLTRLLLSGQNPQGTPYAQIWWPNTWR